MQIISGVYEIKNTANGKLYIGSTANLNKRSWNKYGSGSFEFNLLFRCDNNMLLYYEQMLMDYYHPEFNTSKTAGNCLGVKHSEQAKINMGLAHRGNKNSVGNKNCVGRVLSEETKRKMGLVHIGNKYCLGKHHSEETKRKLSIAHIGVSPANKGIPMSDEQREKMRLAWVLRKAKGELPWNKGTKGLQVSWCKGLKATDEMKAKMREAWARRKLKYSNKEVQMA
jgi:hypothetical protein